MKLVLTGVSEFRTETYRGGYLMITIDEIDPEDLLDQFEGKDFNRLISHIDLEEIIKYHRHEEIIERIGVEKVEQYIKER